MYLYLTYSSHTFAMKKKQRAQDSSGLPNDSAAGTTVREYEVTDVRGYKTYVLTSKRYSYHAR